MEPKLSDSKPHSLIRQYASSEISDAEFMSRALEYEAEAMVQDRINERRIEKHDRQIRNRIFGGYIIAVVSAPITITGAIIDNPYLASGGTGMTVLGSTMMIMQSSEAMQQIKNYIPHCAGKKAEFDGADINWDGTTGSIDRWPQ